MINKASAKRIERAVNGKTIFRDDTPSQETRPASVMPVRRKRYYTPAFMYGR